MNTASLIKELVLDTGKAVNEAGFKNLDALHDGIEKAAGEALARAPWLTDDHRAAVNNWFETARKGRHAVKAAVDENIKTVEGWFASLN